MPGDFSFSALGLRSVPLPIGSRAARGGAFDIAYVFQFCRLRWHKLKIDCARNDGSYHDGDRDGEDLSENSNPAMEHIFMCESYVRTRGKHTQGALMPLQSRC